MSKVIGVLLPRSTDHPGFGFDILDGLRTSLVAGGMDDVRLVPENIGFGENKKEIYAKAEKLIMQDDAFCIVAYLSPANAESIYALFETAGRALIVIDAGMTYASGPTSKHAVHISYQGIHAAYLSGRKAGQNSGKVIMATSFYDGGYRGPWAYDKGIKDVGGAIIHHYVSHHKEADFTVQPFVAALSENNDSVVGACFSTYLASLFVNSLSKENGAIRGADFYCSSYMVEEQTMRTYTLPSSGRFYAHVPWFSGLDSEENEKFKLDIKEAKDKEANLFHLMGWEAGMIAADYTHELKKTKMPIASALAGRSYNSPRGMVKIHPEVHHAFGPIYFTEVKQEAGHTPQLSLLETTQTEETEYLKVMNDKPQGPVSGWYNQYLCT